MIPRLSHGQIRSAAIAALLACAASPAVGQVMVADGALYRMNVISVRDIPFRTVVRQQYDYSCGSAALATLLSYHYGVKVSEGEVFKAMYESGDHDKIKSVGFSLLDMKRYLDSRGLPSDGYRATFEQLEAANVPAILVVKTGTYRHFVVLKGVTDDKVLIGDPALGLRRYSRAEFMAMWNGIAFAIHARPGTTIAFNQAEEWRPWAVAPLDDVVQSELSISSFTRELPPIYQVTDRISLDPIFQ